MSPKEFDIIMERLNHLEALIKGAAPERQAGKEKPAPVTSFQKRCQESQARYLKNQERRARRLQEAKS